MSAHLIRPNLIRPNLIRPNLVRPLLALGLALAATATQAGDGRNELVVADAYGHQATASPVLCPYQAIDVSAGLPLAPVAAGNAGALDDGAAALQLAEAFPFYGIAQQKVSVSTNGYIAFVENDGDDDGGDFNNDLYLPSVPDNVRTASARILAYHDELNGEGGSASMRSAYFASCPRPSVLANEACSVITWSNWTKTGSSGSLGMSLVLYHASGNIAIQYASLDASAGNSACVGMQSDGAMDGVSWSCNGGRTLTAASAVCLFDPQHLPAGAETPLFRDGFELSEG